MRNEHEVRRVEPVEMEQCPICCGWFPLVWITPMLKGLPRHSGDDRVLAARED